MISKNVLKDYSKLYMLRMKFPDLNAKQCLEIMNYIKENGTKRQMILKYDLDYRKVNKIIRVLAEYKTIEEIEAKLNNIKEENIKRGNYLLPNGQIDHHVNYIRYKSYYTRKNHERANKKLES